MGLYNGNWTWYYLDGSIHRDESYRNGKASGLFREWNSSGELIVEGTYDFGLKTRTLDDERKQSP